MIERKKIYLTHSELCEMFDVPEETAIMADDEAMLWNPAAEIWQLSIMVGSKEEIDKAAEEE